ncbi:hypothetical protein ACJX0J_006298, partial [Zea mays]
MLVLAGVVPNPFKILTISPIIDHHFVLNTFQNIYECGFIVFQTKYILEVIDDHFHEHLVRGQSLRQRGTKKIYVLGKEHFYFPTHFWVEIYLTT